MGPIDTDAQEKRAMCTDHHDGTCTAILTRSPVADHLEMKLVCESCETVLKVLGSFEHKFEPLLHSTVGC